MKFKTQLQVLTKLENETRRDLRQLEDAGARQFVDLWDVTRIELAAAVMREYRQDFPRGDWDVVQAEQKGTLRRIRRSVNERVGHFRNQASSFMRGALRQIYKAELARGIWMLDSTTPESVTVGQPSRARTHESSAPQDYAAGWQDALDGWIRAYEDTFAANLRLEALHEGTLEDAADEVDATKIGGAVPANKFQSLFTNQALIAMQDARDDIAGANGGGGDDDAGTDTGGLDVEEIWMTMEDSGVCPICDAYDGKPYADVGDDIPAHFNCRCYMRIVPKPWAELLRSGNAADKETALKMDDAGLVPDSMAIRGVDGELVGTIVVPFEKWAGGRGTTIYNMAIIGVTP